MDAHQHRLAVGDVALDQREVMLAVHGGAIEQQVEGAVVGRQLHALLQLDELFAAAAVFDEIEDGAELELVLLLEREQVGQPRHGAVVLDDFAEHAGGIEARQAREVDRGLGVAAALEHAARLGAQRKDVAGLDEVAGLRFRVGEQADRLRAVLGADAGGDVVRGVDGDGEVGFEALAVVEHHAVEAEPRGAFVRDRRADQAAAKAHHEVDALRRRLFRGEDEVALVLALGVVDHDDRLARADVAQDGVDRVDAGLDFLWRALLPGCCFPLHGYLHPNSLEGIIVIATGHGARGSAHPLK